MAWIYLVDTEVSPSLSQTGSDLSHTVKSSDTLKEFYSLASQKVYSQRLLYGTMLGLFPPKISEEQSISYTEDSLVRISQLQVLAKAWKGSGAVFSMKCVAWSKNSIRVSSFWKTYRPLGLEVFERLSENLQLWGMTVGGRVSLPQKLAPRTSGKGGFSLLPTPTASRYGTSNNGCPGDGRKEYRTKGKMSLETMASRNTWPTAANDGGPWPTPAAQETGRNLAQWDEKKKQENRSRPCHLAVAVQVWPTPMARDYKDTGKGFSEQNRKSPGLASAVAGGKLNPTWVEWLMGVPLEWTVLKPSVTEWYRLRRK